MIAPSAHCNTSQRSVDSYARRPILRTGLATPCAAFSSFRCSFYFYQRDSIGMLRAGIAIARMSVRLSVCPSVRHTLVLYQNEQRYKTSGLSQNSKGITPNEGFEKNPYRLQITFWLYAVLKAMLLIKSPRMRQNAPF